MQQQSAIAPCGAQRSRSRSPKANGLARHFARAHSLTGSRRASYVAAVRARDSALEAELSSLLAASAAAGLFLEMPPPRPESSEPLVARATARDVVGPWRLLRLVGQGGTSDVFEAAHAVTRQTAAVKIELPQKLPSRAQRREVAILERLAHAAIPRLLDSGSAGVGPYIAMELIDGKPVTEHCDSSQADLRERLRLFGELCRAVEYLHASGVVHCDIKPSNVLVDLDGRVRLIDLGSAIRAGADRRSEEPFHSWTRDYAAPEQLRGEPLTTATDVYALGVLLFELLVGRQPWPSSLHPFAHLHAAGARRAPPLTGASANKVLSRCRISVRELDRIIAKCLATEPGQRYACAATLAAECDRCVRRLAAAGSRSRPSSRTVVSPLLEAK